MVIFPRMVEWSFLREITQAINCSPGTIMNELRWETPLHKSNRGRAPEYNAKLGQAVYKINRKRCKKRHRILECSSLLFLEERYKRKA